MTTGTATGVATAISVERLSKSFGPVRAVAELSFTAEPGTITGFLGLNGAGKTTTLRAILGLVTPTAGRALIGDRTYAELERPAEVVGWSSRPRASIRVAAPATTFGWSAPPPASPRRGSTRSSPSSLSRRWRIVRSGATRSGCGSGSAWRRPCWAGHRC